MLTVAALCELTSWSPATVWRASRDGRLPAPVKIGPNSTRWREDEVTAALEKLARASRRDREPAAVA